MLYKNAMLLYDKSNIFNISFDEKMATGVGKVNIIRLHDDQVQLIDNNVIVWTEFENCKLILRDIPQLTDEEKQYIIDKNFMHNIEVLFEYDINEIIRNTYSNKTIKLIDYFREIGIDIDGMFASGKAVKE